MKIAIIGSGIAGLTCAYLLSKKHEITLFESNDYIGGHTYTHSVKLPLGHYEIDTGFIVFNNITYPNFTKLLTQLNVATKFTQMGFSVSCEKTGLEYNGSSLNKIFSQRRNLLNPEFYRLLFDILRFNRMASELINITNPDKTIEDFLQENNFSNIFRYQYLLPMAAALWSAPFDNVAQMPLVFLVRFFANHGLLNTNKHLQWQVIAGGSAQYIKKLTAPFQDRIYLSTPINSVQRHPDYVTLNTQLGEKLTFDQVICANHSDQALTILKDATVHEQKILSAIPYRSNDVVLHYDPCLLPKNPRAWASWNYRNTATPGKGALVTYYMNELQGLSAPYNFCVTLNQTHAIDPEKIIARFNYSHPQYFTSAVNMQQKFNDINGLNRSYFCGAYWGYGFHEDGVNSALRVCQHFGVKL